MWRRRTTFVKKSLVVFDTIVSAGAFIAALFLRDQLARLDGGSSVVAAQIIGLMDALGGLPPPLDPKDYQLLLIALLPLWAFSLNNAQTGDFRTSYRRAFVRYTRAVLVGVGLLILLTFLFKLRFVARTFVVMFAGTQLLSLIIARIVALELVRAFRRRRGDAHRLVIVGAGAQAVEFARNLKQHSPGVEVLGFVSVHGEQGNPAARPHLGFVGSLESLLDRLPVDEVVFAVPGKQPELFREALLACEDRGIDVLLTLPPQLQAQANMEVANVSGINLPMLGLRRTPTGELRLAAKRVLDMTGGLVGLAIAGPVMAVLAVLIRLDSKGPVLFRQVRAGRNGRKFSMLKFRSMVIDAEAKKAALMHLNEMGGPVFKIKRDPRITKVGAFIRKTSLDELPQFFNILMGDMSLVGPRPPLPSEVADYEPWQRRRLSVKPGLTGLWQVSGRNQIDFEEWMKLDLDYIDNWSLWLDIKILAKTIPTVLFHKGAS